MTRTIALLSLLTLVAAAETVEIRSAADWDSFATRVNDGEATLNAVLMRDVTLAGSSPRCGFPETRRFRGEFDGNGKTLTVGIKVTNAGAGNPAAPFAYVSDGCHIHDLRTAGTIETDGKFAAGLIGVAEQLDNGLVMLERCRSSVAIACTVDGDATSGGLLGCSRSSYPIIVVVDCLFDGSIVGANANSCGGLVGWRQSATVGTRNSLFAPSELSLGETDAFTLVRNGFKSAADCSNTWYTRVYGEAQGLDGRGKTAAELVAALGGNWVAVEEDGVTKAVPRFVVSQNDNIPDPNRGILAFTYQGTLRDAQGNALAQKSHTIAFRIYGQATGGSPHWGRRHRVTLDDDGLFALEISDVAGEEIEGVAGTGLADVLADNAGTTLYFGLAVDGGEAEISPRQKLLASPAATCAADTANARGDMSVAGDAAAEGAHVAEAVHADAEGADAAAERGARAGRRDRRRPGTGAALPRGGRDAQAHGERPGGRRGHDAPHLERAGPRGMLGAVSEPRQCGHGAGQANLRNGGLHAHRPEASSPPGAGRAGKGRHPRAQPSVRQSPARRGRHQGHPSGAALAQSLRRKTVRPRHHRGRLLVLIPGRKDLQIGINSYICTSNSKFENPMKVVNLGENPSVLNNFIAEMRDATIQKDSLRFRINLERVGEVFAYEISKVLTFSEKEVITPLGTARVATTDTPLVISTILRAGLPLQKGIFNFFDHAETAFLAAFRKYGAGDWFEIRADYCTTPSLEGKTLVLADTMLATGSSIEVAIDKLRQEGGEPIAIHLVCPIASTYAVDHLAKRLGDEVTLWVAAIDEELTSHSAFGEKL